MVKKITRKQLDKLIEDLETARLYLIILLADRHDRKAISDKTGISSVYLNDFVKGRKKISDTMVINILNKWID